MNEPPKHNPHEYNFIRSLNDAAVKHKGDKDEFLKQMSFLALQRLPRQILLQAIGRLLAETGNLFLVALDKRDTEGIQVHGSSLYFWIVRLLAANNAVVNDDEFDEKYGPNADIIAFSHDYPFLDELILEIDKQINKDEELNATFPVEN